MSNTFHACLPACLLACLLPFPLSFLLIVEKFFELFSLFFPNEPKTGYCTRGEHGAVLSLSLFFFSLSLSISNARWSASGNMVYK